MRECACGVWLGRCVCVEVSVQLLLQVSFDVLGIFKRNVRCHFVRLSMRRAAACSL